MIEQTAQDISQTEIIAAEQAALKTRITGAINIIEGQTALEVTKELGISRDEWVNVTKDDKLDLMHAFIIEKGFATFIEYELRLVGGILPSAEGE